MSIVGGIVSGVGSLLGGLGSSAMNDKAVQDTNKTNMEIAKYQAQWQQQENEKAYQRSLKMWNLQNEYNSPTQQMARIRAAGLDDLAHVDSDARAAQILRNLYRFIADFCVEQ